MSKQGIEQLLENRDYRGINGSMTKKSIPEITPIDRSKRGPRPGVPHSGQFKKGHDSRRYVPGVTPNTLRTLVRPHLEKIVEKLLANLDDKDPRVANTAAKELLDRGFGKAITPIATKSMDPSTPSQLTTEDLLRIAQGDGLNGSEVIEGVLDEPSEAHDTNQQ